MPGDASLLLWIVLVVAGIAAMQWGAARASAALDAYRASAGMTGTVAGTLLGIATATPEISVNVASVAFGWPDLGLGTALGSNVPALPFVFLLSWLSLRRAARAGVAPDPAGAGAPDGGADAALEHLDTRNSVAPADAPGAAPVPLVKPAANAVQAWPYLLVVLLLAALTLPPAWAGLQPVDGAILAGAWALYAARAIRRPRREPSAPPPGRRRLWRGALGVPAIALGALASVQAARRLGDAFGASDLVVGLFVIGLLCALPESFTAWRLAREGRATTAVSTAMADGIVSLTLALLPPSLAGTAVGDVALYVVNLALLGFVLVAYVVMNRTGHGQTLGGARVAVFSGAYLAYLAIVGVLLAR